MKKAALTLSLGALLLSGCGQMTDTPSSPTAVVMPPEEVSTITAEPSTEPEVRTETAPTSTSPVTTAETAEEEVQETTTAVREEQLPDTQPAAEQYTQPPAETATKAPIQAVEDDIFSRLDSLGYLPYNCDGLYEYTLVSGSGEVYYLNFSGKWVWKHVGGECHEAVLPDDIISWLTENGSSMGMEPSEWLPE